MRKVVRLDLAAGLALSISALLGVGGFVSPATAAGPAVLTDPAGDVIDRNTNDRLPSPRTDLVSATVDSGAPGIVLTFKTQEMANPGTDPNWASLNTFVSWQVDSTGDGKVDDLIRFSADRKTPGALVGEVTHWPGPGQPAQHCDAPATFDPAAGYSVTIAPSCLGNPAAISYRVQLTYDTKPGEAKPPLAFDVLPDQGLAGPVAIAVPTAPAAAPPAAGAPAPSPDPATAPTAGPSAPKATAPAAKPAPKPAAPKATTPTRSRDAAAAAPKPAAPAPAAPAPAAGPNALAATGANSPVRWLGALGGVLLLLGGLGVMTPVDRRRRLTA